MVHLASAKSWTFVYPLGATEPDFEPRLSLGLNEGEGCFGIVDEVLMAVSVVDLLFRLRTRDAARSPVTDPQPAEARGYEESGTQGDQGEPPG